MITIDNDLIKWWTHRLVRDKLVATAKNDQLLALVCEMGELAQEWSLIVNANPRKQNMGSHQRVVDELCDVIISGTILLDMVSTSYQADLDERLNHVTARMNDKDEDSRAAAMKDVEQCSIMWTSHDGKHQCRKMGIVHAGKHVCSCGNTRKERK